MNRLPCTRTACFAVAAAVLALAALAGPAGGAPPCAQKVLEDWLADERIDGVYPLPCYEAALDAIPLDLRDYTSAVDVIGRALAGAVRRNSGQNDGPAAAAPAVDPATESGLTSLPIPLLVLGGLSLALLGAGAVGHFARRRRAAEPGDLPED